MDVDNLVRESSNVSQQSEQTFGKRIPQTAARATFSMQQKWEILPMSQFESQHSSKKGGKLKYNLADRAPFIPMKLLSEALNHKHVILPGPVMSVLWSTIDSWQTSSTVLI